MGDIYASLHLFPEAKKKYEQAKMLHHPKAEEGLAKLKQDELQWPIKIEYTFGFTVPLFLYF